MLDKFKKYFSTKVDATTASADNKEEVLNMNTENLAEMTAQLATVNEALTTLQASFAELNTKYEAAQAALNESEAATKLLAEKAATARLEARTKAIAEAIGTSELTSLLEVTDGMDDVKFNVIIGAMAKSFENESKSAMFQEKGVTEEKPAVVVDPVQNLAKALADEFKQV